jgi:hypothetical protein
MRAGSRKSYGTILKQRAKIVPHKPWKEATHENLAAYWNWLECCNILRDITVYYCPFCTYATKHVKRMFDHVEEKHEYYGRGQ